MGYTKEAEAIWNKICDKYDRDRGDFVVSKTRAFEMINEALAQKFLQPDVSGNEALRVAVAFAQWITVYASQLGNGWVIMKGTEPTMQTTEQLYDEFQRAKATDR